MNIDSISKFLDTETGIDRINNSIVNVKDETVVQTMITNENNNLDDELNSDDYDDEDDYVIQNDNTSIVEYNNTEVSVVLDKETEEDFNNARTNIRDLISKGMDALDDMICVVKESENAKGYESVANYMKTMVELNEKLLNINNKAPKESNVNNTQTNINNTNNIICTTSPADLLNALKGKM